MVTLNLLIEAGSRHDPKGREGLAHLTARLLTHGTRSRTSPEISETLDFIGASLNTGSDTDLASVSLTLLKKDLDTGLNLLAEILTTSVFPEAEIDRQKQSVIASIRAKEEDPGEIAQEKFLESLFPQHFYGRPVEGTEDSVRTIERRSLVEFYERFYRPNGAILAVVGDISHQEMAERLGKAFALWEKRDSVREPSPAPSAGKPGFVRIDKNLTQANVIIGHQGVSRGHPDYYAIQVMNYILGGGGFSSRLMDSIRNERGFAYSVYSAFDAEKYIGTFQVTMQTKNETAEEAIRIAKEEVQRIRERGVTDEELQAAKDYLIGSFPLRLDTNRRIAGFLAQVEYLELGLDYPERYAQLIQRVAKNDILRAAKLYLQPEKFIVIVVADQEKAQSKR
jgi:zinc protease